MYSSSPLPLVQMKPSPTRPARRAAAGPGGGDVDRHGVLRPVVDGRLVGLEELAVEGHEVLGPQLLDQRDRLAQPGEALALLGPVDADRDLVHRLAGADAEDDPVLGEAAEGRERLGHDRRVVPERGREDAGPERDPGRRGRRRAQPDEGVRGMAVGVSPGLEVVAGPHRVVAGAFGRDGEVEEAAGMELLGRRLVAEGQRGLRGRHRGLHGHDCCISGRPRAPRRRPAPAASRRSGSTAPVGPAPRPAGPRPTATSARSPTRAAARRSRAAPG